ncbi:hypothetical protein [Nitratireductor pacificus]|nr:hypothetical protein [Nitratireductor pacificus]
MAQTPKPDGRARDALDAGPGIHPDSSLLPMLIWGLVLIVVGAVVVMAFV